MQSDFTPSQPYYDRGAVPSTRVPSVKAQTKPAQAAQPAQSQSSQSQQSTQSHEEQYTAGPATNNDTMQDNVLHDSSGRQSNRNKNAPTVKRKVSKDVIQIRDFPRDVMDIVRGVVPGGNSYVETLLAYIYVTSQTKFDIPPSVQEIVDSYVNDDQLTQVFKEIRLLREQVKNVEVSSYQSALASEYTLFNALGMRTGKIDNPSNINYLEPGVEDMHIALEDTAKQLKKKDMIRHGRR